MTGKPPGGGLFCGAQTLRYKQSSLSGPKGLANILIVKFRAASGSGGVSSKSQDLDEAARTIELLHASISFFLRRQRRRPWLGVFRRAESRGRTLCKRDANPRVDSRALDTHNWAGIGLGHGVLRECGRQQANAYQKLKLRHYDPIEQRKKNECER